MGTFSYRHVELLEHVASQRLGQQVGSHLFSRTVDESQKLFVVLLSKECPLNAHMTTVSLKVSRFGLHHSDAGAVIFRDDDLLLREAELNENVSSPKDF